MIPVFKDDEEIPNRINVYKQNGEKFGYIEPKENGYFLAVGPYFRKGVSLSELPLAKQVFFNNIKD